MFQAEINSSAIAVENVDSASSENSITSTESLSNSNVNSITIDASFQMPVATSQSSIGANLVNAEIGLSLGNGMANLSMPSLGEQVNQDANLIAQVNSASAAQFFATSSVEDMSTSMTFNPSEVLVPQVLAELEMPEFNVILDINALEIEEKLGKSGETDFEESAMPQVEKADLLSIRNEH